MEIVTAHRDEYRQWPFLDQEEFELASAFFDQKYVRAKLGATRKAFKVRSRRVMTTGESYIEILQLLQPPEDADELSVALSRLGGGGGLGENADAMIDAEMKMDSTDEDGDVVSIGSTRLLRSDLGSPVVAAVVDVDFQEALTKPEAPPQYAQYSHQPYVTYEIHLHPTYRVPTLWFTLHDLPMGEPTFDLDSVYRFLVPPEYKSNLRAAGVTGGISAAPHPITDIPAFFVHPCQTNEAMEGFDCSLENYLMVWIGLVGGCVGLWVPPEMARSGGSN